MTDVAEYSARSSPPGPTIMYDIFSGAVHIDRPYGALNIFHTEGSVVGVVVDVLVLKKTHGWPVGSLESLPNTGCPEWDS